MRKDKITLKEYFRAIRSQQPDPASVELDVVLKNNPFIEGASILSNSTVYIYDVPNNLYLYMSEHVKNTLGYTAEEFKRGGMDFAYSLMHPEDRDTVLAMSIKGFEFLMALPVDGLKSAKYSLDFRCLHPKKGVIRLLNQISVLQVDSEGKFVLTLGTGTDITHLKKENHIMLNLVAAQGAIETHVYTPSTGIEKTEGGLISPREKEVLELISQGYSSKEAAEKLFISAHTVDTHRRKMIEKSHVKDFSSLISYLYAIGLMS